MSIRDTLETIAWAEKHFGSLTTNRQCKRRDVMRAVNSGLAESVGLVPLCDDEGSIIEPERFREGFKLTQDGMEFLATNSPHPKEAAS